MCGGAEGRVSQISFRVCVYGDGDGSTGGVCGEGRVIPGRSACPGPFKAALARPAPTLAPTLAPHAGPPTLLSVKPAAECQQTSPSGFCPRAAACPPSAGLVLAFILLVLCDQVGQLSSPRVVLIDAGPP